MNELMTFSRFLKSWVVLTLWLGLLPVCLVAMYYALSSENFQSIYNSSNHGLLFAVQVGSESYRSSSAGFMSSSFGANAKTSIFDNGREEVSTGTLSGVYQWTCLGWFRGKYYPVAFSVVRRVGLDDHTTDSIVVNGSGPIVHYLTFCSLLGAAAVVVLRARKRSATNQSNV